MKETPPTEKPVVVHEDDDPLVVAATKAAAPGSLVRKPGLLRFAVEDIPKDESVEVMRSRFDGTYGNVCRMKAYKGETGGPVNVAPSQFVLDALHAGPLVEACTRLMKLYHEWKKKG